MYDIEVTVAQRQFYPKSEILLGKIVRSIRNRIITITIIVRIKVLQVVSFHFIAEKQVAVFHFMLFLSSAFLQRWQKELVSMATPI